MTLVDKYYFNKYDIVLLIVVYFMSQFYFLTSILAVHC